jgi:hypothetical protein
MAGKKGPGRRAADGEWRAVVMSHFHDLTPAGRREALLMAVRRQEALLADALSCKLSDLARSRRRVLAEMRKELARLTRITTAVDAK